MSTGNARQQNKQPLRANNNGNAKQAAIDPSRRHSAWGVPRTFSPSPSTTPKPQPASTTFPPLNGAGASASPKPTSSILLQLSGLTGTTVTISTKKAQRYEGVVASTTSTDGADNTPGLTLKDVKEITKPGAPLQDQLFVATTNIETWSSGPADAKFNGDSFRTDTDISTKKPAPRERELQAWNPSGDDMALGGGLGDEDTFGSTGGKSWDQFATNEKLFNVTTSFDEELYTTKLDRTAAGFEERAKKAERIANEINGTATSNPHLAEERNQADDSGINEEDKYGAVVRGAKSYIPPGARKPDATAKPAEPKVSVTGPDGAAASGASAKPPADAFRDFVTNEKVRLTQKRAALMKNDMDKRVADLLKFSQSFKLNKPMPEDLVTILSKDEEKQKAIREKSLKDAESAKARSIGTGGNAPVAQRPPPTQQSKQALAGKPAAMPTKPSAQVIASASINGKPPAKKVPVSMLIPEIPPFRGAAAKAKSPPAPTVTVNGAPLKVIPTHAQVQAEAKAKAEAAAKLNANASSFRPTAANAKGGSAGASANGSPRAKEPAVANPFFGTKPPKRGPMNIKEDFNPYKQNKVGEANIAAPTWQYSGKRYVQALFPTNNNNNNSNAHGHNNHNNNHNNHHHQAPHMQQHGPNMQQHASPRMGGQQQPAPVHQPPPPYEEEPSHSRSQPPQQQQQPQQPPQPPQPQQQQYMYYPQYAYGQPMMPGMPPPQFVATPYGMQPIGYPGMPPNAMYAAPGMGMPPPGPYMHPPPGMYPQPPPQQQQPGPQQQGGNNGQAQGGRLSMPPTPIPAHAHAYYQHSPQLAHMQIPYPMMMQPPPNGMQGPPPGPPQAFEQPVGMNGNGH